METELRSAVQTKAFEVIDVLVTGFSELGKSKIDGLDAVEAGVFAALLDDFQAKAYPRLSTILACAELLDMDVQLVPRTPQSKIILVN